MEIPGNIVDVENNLVGSTVLQYSVSYVFIDFPSMIIQFHAAIVCLHCATITDLHARHSSVHAHVAMYIIFCVALLRYCCERDNGLYRLYFMLE